MLGRAGVQTGAGRSLVSAPGLESSARWSRPAAGPGPTSPRTAVASLPACELETGLSPRAETAYGAASQRPVLSVLSRYRFLRAQGRSEAGCSARLRSPPRRVSAVSLAPQALPPSRLALGHLSLEHGSQATAKAPTKSVETRCITRTCVRLSCGWGEWMGKTEAVNFTY